MVDKNNYNDLVNFMDSRKIKNCHFLCYTNSAMHLLYSIVEFRELIYNTDSIKNSNTSISSIVPQIEINDLFYRLKYIFYLMNRILVPTVHNNTKYESRNGFYMNNNTLECNREDSGPNTEDKLWLEIYRDFIIGSTILYYNNTGNCYNFATKKFKSKKETKDEDIRDIEFLEQKDYSTNTIVYYLSIFNDLSQQLFSYDNNGRQFNYIISYSPTPKNPMTPMSPDIVLKKYIFIKNPYDANYVYPNEIIVNTNKYLKYALIVGDNEDGFGTAGGHFWTLIYNHSTNDYTEINDLPDYKPFNSNYIFNNEGIECVLYVREYECMYCDNFPIDQQLIHLSNLSNRNPTTNLEKLNYDVLLRIIKKKLL